MGPEEIQRSAQQSGNDCLFFAAMGKKEQDGKRKYS
jgi:hypothetical protein